MNIRRFLFRDAEHRGESSARRDAKIRKPIPSGVRLRAIALLGVAVLAVATVESCTATRRNDGSITFAFAPDMTITAWGLEDALHQLHDLYKNCLNGSWQRACTSEELAGIQHMEAGVLRAKHGLNRN